MKSRLGFVSNSSSSSFSVYGCYVRSSSDDFDTNYDLNIISRAAYDSNLDFIQDRYDGWAVIGLSWDEIGDDETGKEFRNRVQSTIAKILGNEKKCETITETYEY